MSMEKVWVVFQTLTGRERKARELLEKFVRESNLQDRIGRILVPSETIQKKRNVKGHIVKITVEKPVYRGYIFVEMEQDPELVEAIQKATGLRALLAKEPDGGYTFTTLSPEEIERIQKIIEEEQKRKEAKVPYLKGDRVRIIAGAFKGMEAVVDEVIPEKEKLKVLIDMFGRETPVELGFLEVERISK